MKMEEEDIERLRVALARFTGTENYYRHFTGVKYTDGVRFLAEKLGCFWFLDVIASYQHMLMDVPFQIWKIEKDGDCAGVVTMKEDSDQPVRIRQQLSYTDFPLEEYEVYCIDGVILLKSEY